MKDREEYFKRYRLVDHNHITGNTRALLCGPCNVGLGVYEKKKDLFEAYLKEYPQ